MEDEQKIQIFLMQMQRRAQGNYRVPNKIRHYPEPILIENINRSTNGQIDNYL